MLCKSSVAAVLAVALTTIITPRTGNELAGGRSFSMSVPARPGELGKTVLDAWPPGCRAVLSRLVRVGGEGEGEGTPATHSWVDLTGWLFPESRERETRRRAKEEEWPRAEHGVRRRLRHSSLLLVPDRDRLTSGHSLSLPPPKPLISSLHTADFAPPRATGPRSSDKSPSLAVSRA